MTHRFARSYQTLRARLGGRRGLALTIIGIWIAVELLAVAAVAIAGKEWLETKSPPAKADSGGTPAPGFSAARSTPSISVF